MSENEEYMPLFIEIEKDDCCIECKKTLRHFREGTTSTNNRCHNCYWRDHNSRARQESDIVPLICCRCENTFDWKIGIGNFCDDCSE